MMSKIGVPSGSLLGSRFRNLLLLVFLCFPLPSSGRGGLIEDCLFDLRPRKAPGEPRTHKQAGYYDYIVCFTYIEGEGRRRGHIRF